MGQDTDYLFSDKLSPSPMFSQVPIPIYSLNTSVINFIGSTLLSSEAVIDDQIEDQI